MAKKPNKKSKSEINIDCNKCITQADCCKFGAWADLEEAKKIVPLNLKGEFFQLETDKHFPSGFRIGTSYDNNSCSFLDNDGLCSIHKIDYGLKPQSCKEFPYEGKKLSSFAKKLCTLHKSTLIKSKKIP